MENISWAQITFLGSESRGTGGLAPRRDGRAANHTASRRALAGPLARWAARLVKPLLAAGADPAAADALGWRPLHYAADYGDSRLVRRLLAAGASPGDTTNAGHTPASLARRKGHRAVLAALAAAGDSTAAEVPPEFVQARPAGPPPGVSIPCEIDTVAADTLTWADFRARYLWPGRPVLLANSSEVRGWPAWRRWRRGPLLAAHGRVEFEVARVPYPAQYGLPSRRVTLAQFIEEPSRTGN
jgi:hypothetical protein